VFVVDDLVGWLIGRLADAGYQKLTTLLRGSDQARALKQAVAAAVQATVGEIGPSGGEEAEWVAEQITKAFRRREPVPLSPGQPTLLEALQAGIAGQLSVLDDAGQPAVSLPGVPVSDVAAKLTGHLVRQIQVRGSRGGALADLADQLNHDLTHLQGQRLEGMLARVLDWQGDELAPPVGAAGPVGWSGLEPASRGEFRSDLVNMVDAMAEQARKRRLPAYLPAGADASTLTRTVQLRRGIRPGPGGERSGTDASGQYRLAAERPADRDPPRPWPEVAAEHRRLVVLGDPGLGKSWLIRTETLRLARAARAALDDSPRDAVIPVPLRCDQLDAAPGADLAAKAAAHLAGQGVLAGRSQDRLAAKVRDGTAVLLLDALDELTPEAAGRVRELLQRWSETAGRDGRCVVTSRIAGYTGSPVPGAAEVEVQPFSHDDVAEAVAGWQLPSAAAAELAGRLRDPAVGAMARIPLMLALLCSLAAQDPAGQSLPRTRGQLYERVLRWFLTGAHRSPDSPAALTRGDVAVDAMLEILAPLAFTFATAPRGLDRPDARRPGLQRHPRRWPGIHRTGPPGR
jgi:hypothetical protein